MNRIEELIQELCPGGVEFKKTQDVCKKISSGGTPLTTRSEYYNGNIPWLRTQEVDWTEITETSMKISDEGLKNSSANWIPANCVIVAMYGATAAKVAINTIPLTTNQACCNLEIDEELANYRYVFYWLKKEYQNLKALGEGSQSNINGQKVKNFQIPIPPLPIQQEIVNILDKFTQLEAELEAEREARRKQYEFYLNQLMEFQGKEVEWKTLEEVAKYSRTRIDASETDKDTYVGVDNLLQNKQGKTFSNYMSTLGQITKYEKGDTLIGNIRPYLRKIWYASNSGGSSNDVLVIRRKKENIDNINSKYLYYLLSSECFFNYNIKFSRGAKMPRGDKKMIMQYPIPIPSLSEQERIVSILDKFDTLVNDTTIGIQAEIDARRKQYEYYRNKLLTFDKYE